MNRTVNKKAILIMLGIIAGIALLYFGGFELTRIHNSTFWPINTSRPFAAAMNSLLIILAVCVVIMFCVLLGKLFDVLFPKKEETK